MFSRLAHAFIGVTDWLLAEHPDQHRAAHRIAVGISMGLAMAIVIAAILHLSRGLNSEAMVASMTALAVMLMVVSVRIFKLDPVWLGLGLGTIVGIGVGLNSLEMDGVRSPPVTGLPTLIMVVSLMSGTRLGFVCAAGYTIEVLVLAALTPGDDPMIQEQAGALIINFWLMGSIGAAFGWLRSRVEDASRAKSAFLANMSHEIRTPLNGVLGMLGLMIDDELSPAQKGRAETARASGLALLSLLNDVLDLSKVEAGRLELELIPFHLRHLAEDVAEQYAVSNGTQDVEIILRYEVGAPTRFIGDGGRIRQILVNLVDNACKFTSKGHVLIVVDCTEEGGGEATMRLQVRDTGIGIPTQDQQSVFEKFRQADASTTRNYGGTGLGLAITRELVRLLGGEMGLHSEPGQGATFWVTLPLTVDSTTHDGPLPIESLEGIRVLIVDDHPVNRTVLSDQFERWGFPSKACKSGVEALEQLREAHERGAPWEMVILDHHMPTMDGIMMAEALRKEPWGQDVVLILFTSMVGYLDRTQLDTLRIAGCLTKPLRQSDLMDTMATAWAARQQRRRIPLVTKSVLEAQRSTRAHQRDFAGARVLVVDDNPINQRVASGLLKRLACRVDIAGNGQEAVSLARSVPYELILMDVQMPVMDGLTATEAIREWEAQSDREPLPIIAMTAHALKGDRERCEQAGMNSYLPKPVSTKSLGEMLEQYLPDRGAKRGIADGPSEGARTEASAAPPPPG